MGGSAELRLHDNYGKCISLSEVRAKKVNFWHTIRLLLHSQSIGGGRLPLCGSYERVLAADDGGIGGSAIDQYLSHSYYDDLAWAAAWLYRASSTHLAAANHVLCMAGRILQRL